MKIQKTPARSSTPDLASKVARTRMIRLGAH